jgi:type VI secretion system VasD/TssJ family lipoprotein
VAETGRWLPAAGHPSCTEDSSAGGFPLAASIRHAYKPRRFCVRVREHIASMAIMPHNFMFHRRGMVAVLVVFLALAGCGGPPPMSVRAVAPVNLNDEGESLPVRLRIYELRDRSRFMAAAFNDLWLDDRKALGPDRLADPRQVVIAPGKDLAEPRRFELISVAEDTRFIGIMALFPRTGEQDERRAVVPLDELDDHVIELSGYRLTLKDR